LIDLFWVNGCHPEGICRQHINNQKITNNKTLVKRNPLPLTVSCASLGHEGPTVYIQTKEKKERKKKQKQKQTVPRTDKKSRVFLCLLGVELPSHRYPVDPLQKKAFPCSTVADALSLSRRTHNAREG
jgi:hypothetical protein